MISTELIAILALVISGAALTLELRRWFDDGPKIVVSVMADATLFPDDDGKEKLALSAVNRGNTPTTLTHFVAFTYKSKIHKLLKKPISTGLVANPGMHAHAHLPQEIGVNKTWMGLMNYSDKLQKARVDGQLYVGVIATHSNKTYLAKVQAKKLDIPENEI